MTRASYTVAYWFEDNDGALSAWVAEVVYGNEFTDGTMPGRTTEYPSFAELETEVRDMIHVIADVPADSFDVEMIQGLPVYVRLGSDDDRYLGIVANDAEAQITLLARLARTARGLAFGVPPASAYPEVTA